MAKGFGWDTGKSVSQPKFAYFIPADPHAPKRAPAFFIFSMTGNPEGTPGLTQAPQAHSPPYEAGRHSAPAPSPAPPLGHSQMPKFGDRRHVNPPWGRGAVAAVHAVPLPADFWAWQQRRLQNLPPSLAVHRPGCSPAPPGSGPLPEQGRPPPGGSGGIVDALVGGVRATPAGERSALEQVSPAERFHHRDAHTQALAGLVQALPLPGPCSPGAFHSSFRSRGPPTSSPGRLQVIAGIDAEHQHVHKPLVCTAARGRLGLWLDRPMAPDDSPLLQLPGIGHHRAGTNRLPVRQRVHIVNHTNFHMVCAQALQLILESLPHLFDFPGALVLAVLPNGAQVGLEYSSPCRPWRAAPGWSESPDPGNTSLCS